MPQRYAENTEVTSDRSRAEIERTLVRYGASGFAYGWSGSRAVIEFEMAARRYRFTLPLPDRNADEFRYSPERRLRRTESSQQEAYEQAIRQRWRALSLVIKAKLEAVAAGISTFEEEFLGATVTPSGETVGQIVLPQVREAYATGSMEPLMAGLSQRSLSPGVRSVK